MGAESGAVNSDIHLFSLEEPGGPVHHLAYLGYEESFHSTLDHAMSKGSIGKCCLRISLSLMCASIPS